MGDAEARRTNERRWGIKETRDKSEIEKKRILNTTFLYFCIRSTQLQGRWEKDSVVLSSHSSLLPNSQTPHALLQQITHPPLTHPLTRSRRGDSWGRSRRWWRKRQSVNIHNPQHSFTLQYALDFVGVPVVVAAAVGHRRRRGRWGWWDPNERIPKRISQLLDDGLWCHRYDKGLLVLFFLLLLGMRTERLGRK